MGLLIIKQMKSILSLLLFITVTCTVTASDSIRVGLCTDRVVSTDNRAGVAIALPSSTLQLCKGDQLTEMAFILYKADVQDFKLFITTDLNKETYDYEQTVTESYSLGKWKVITLDTPYTLTGEPLYIGYTLKTEGNAVAYTARYMQGTEFYRDEEGIWQANANGCAAALYALVRGDDLPRRKASITSSKMRLYATTATSLEVSGRLLNDGLDTLRTIELTYTTGNGETGGTLTIEDLEVPYRAAASFAASLPPLPEGDHQVQFTLTKVNGEANQESEGHQSETYHVICNDDFTPRRVLVEMFSTELCSSCPTGHAKVEAAIEACDDPSRVTLLTHHAAFYTDRYTIPASVTYEWFYGDHQLQAPTALFDRTSFHHYYSSYYDGVTPIIYDLTKAPLGNILNDALADPAHVSVEMELQAADAPRTFTVRVHGKQLLTMENDPRLFVYLTEDSLYSTTQSGSGGSYVHNGTIRQCVTDTWGDSIDPSAGYDRLYTVTIPDSQVIANMHVVALVANRDTTDRLNCRIYNSATIPLRTLPALGTTTVMQSAPVPSTHVDVYSLCGQLLRRAVPRQKALQGLPAGLYLVDRKKVVVK